MCPTLHFLPQFNLSNHWLSIRIWRIKGEVFHEKMISLVLNGVRWAPIRLSLLNPMLCNTRMWSSAPNNPTLKWSGNPLFLMGWLMKSIINSTYFLEIRAHFIIWKSTKELQTKIEMQVKTLKLHFSRH